MRNARFSENAMFGLDFVLECEMEQMLDPPRVLEDEMRKRWKAISENDLMCFTIFDDSY